MGRPNARQTNPQGGAGELGTLAAERLGHDIATLRTTYAHLIRKEEEGVRTIFDQTLGGWAEDS
jgi:hypothetical protein